MKLVRGVAKMLSQDLIAFFSVIMWNLKATCIVG